MNQPRRPRDKVSIRSEPRGILWLIPSRIAPSGSSSRSLKSLPSSEEIEHERLRRAARDLANNLLSGRDSRQIEADLDRLLVRLSPPSADRTLVRFELPVPPIPGGYEFARLQRRLGHRHAVRLILRREFAKVLLTPGATTDGLHLSPSGHRALADLLLRTMIPTYK